MGLPGSSPIRCPTKEKSPYAGSRSARWRTAGARWRPPSVPSADELLSQMEAESNEQVKAPDAPLCMGCGDQMVRSGACHVCRSCGSTSGCS